jgi:peptide/nickel transport system permease protein
LTRKRDEFIQKAPLHVFVLVGVSILMFFLVRVIPGDPIANVLGPMATKETVEKMRHEMGLDRPIYIQYLYYVKGIARGDLGMSLVEQRPIATIIKEKLPATAELVLLSIALAVILAIPLGVNSALHSNKFTDHINRIIALFGLSFPQFWIGIMLQLLFGYALAYLPLTGRISGAPPDPITGFYLIDSVLTVNFRAFWDSFIHILMPTIVLCLGPLATITRLIRANMIDQMNKDYINISRATGMPKPLISYKYMLRNAFSSALTMIGFLIPLMLGTAFVVEKVFAWPGIARYGADAILSNDFNGVVGVTLVISLVFVIVNFAVDELYGVLDPRIRMKR